MNSTGTIVDANLLLRDLSSDCTIAVDGYKWAWTVSNVLRLAVE